MYQVIVSQQSAVIGLPGERFVPLYGNHMEISKFSSVEDPNYITISGHISRISKSLLEQDQKYD
jgi:hypothetical protein